MSVRTAILASTFVAAGLALAGCGGSGNSAGTTGSGDSGQGTAVGRDVAVKLVDAGCDPAELRLAAGPVTFQVSNDGADAISEFEILKGDRILGEVENLPPGLSGHFSLTLEPGRFTMYCPGGTSAERGPLVVSGKASETSATAAAAVAKYRRYIESQTVLLTAKTRRFVQKLHIGDLEGAKAAYAEARVPYERIEPVAESFGDLDPAIDARAGDVPKAKWTGFHPIEQFLWVRGATGPAKLRTKLLADVVDLQRRVQTIELEPAQVANGSVELLGEVSKSKITGEEERYSHIDLVDFEANVQGAKAAFDSVRDLVAARRPALVKEIDDRFADVEAALQPYRSGNGFVSYTALSKADTRALSRSIDALAEPLSEVGASVAGQ
jgi:iron uptake system component EfeO